MLCGANSDAVLELTADGSLIYMTTTGGDTGVLHTNSVEKGNKIYYKSYLPRHALPH